MTEAPKTAKRPRAKRIPKPIDTERLQHLAAEIDAMLDGHREALVRRLQVEENMKITVNYSGLHVTLAGIEASATSGEPMALRNWANAARRALLKAGR